MINKLTYCLLVFIGLNACSPSTTSKMSSVEPYTEDLSVHRPTFEKADTILTTKIEDQETVTYPEPEFDVTEKLNFVLDSIDRLKADKSYVDGFTIQVYSGTNSEEAKIARGQVYSLLDGSRPSLKYDEPNFKVKVGQYLTRLEAQKTFAQLKPKLPNSIIIPERIYIENID